MEFKKADFGTNITFKDESGVHTFNQGDDVICIVGDNRYVGTITQIGYYTGDDESDSCKAICIDTSDKKNKRKYSSEIINMDDITYICKNILADTPKLEKTKEEAEKDEFVRLLSGLGYDKEKVERLYTNVRNLMDSMNISLEQMIPCVVYSLQNQCSIDEPLKDMLNIDLGKTLEQYQQMLHFSVGMMFSSLGEVFQVILDEFLPKKKQK